MLSIILFGLLVVYLAIGMALTVFCIQMARWDDDLDTPTRPQSVSVYRIFLSVYLPLLLLAFIWPLALLAAALMKSTDQDDSKPLEAFEIGRCSKTTIDR